MPGCIDSFKNRIPFDVSLTLWIFCVNCILLLDLEDAESHNDDEKSSDQQNGSEHDS